ncbi:hypothetical protein [Kaistia adipata]|uniref:hypothetical protein n=1 Tax=Kaistia adipata TaxID=166954 RepID=UPI001AEC36F2|nr:hypothetical protein [Kaistia adipata]
MTSMLAHFVWLAVVLFLFLGGPFGKSNSTAWQTVRDLFCPSCEKSYDAINVAAQLGRLDLLSLSLTVLATVLAFGAIASFFLIRGAAVHAAAEEATSHISAKLPNLITPEILGEAILNNERIKHSIVSMLRASEAHENQISEGTANQIAAAFEGDKNEH